MPKNWTQLEIQAAFDDALEKAGKDSTLRSELLDPTTVKKAFAAAGDITIPEAVEVVFYRQEDLPARLVVAIPAQVTGGLNQVLDPLRPKFIDCFLCTYETYVAAAADAPKQLDSALKNFL